MPKAPDFYIYVHRRCSDNTIFYIGKGRARRAWSKTNRNPYWLSTVSAHGLTVEIVISGISEDAAFALEVDFISGFRSIGAELVNMTDGGDGVYSGEKAREICSAAGKIGGKVAGPIVGKMFAEQKIGVCAPGMASIGGKIGGKVAGALNAEKRSGVCAPGMASIGGKTSGKANGTRTKLLGIGIHAPGMASIGGKIGGKMPWWVCTKTGKRTRAFTPPGGTFVRGWKCPT